MKKLISSIAIVALVGMMVITAVKAAQTATVTATVTVQNISLELSTTSFNYGTLPAGGSTSTCDVGVPNISVTNNGNVAEDFQIKGNDSTHWTLDSAIGTKNHYVHKFSTSTCGSVNWSTAPALTTSYVNLATNVATSSSATLNLQITTPNPIDQFGPESIIVDVQATAH